MNKKSFGSRFTLPLFFFASAALAAPAEEIRLNAATIPIGEISHFVVVRDALTPERVVLESTMPFETESCAEWGVEVDYGSDESCGRERKRKTCSIQAMERCPSPRPITSRCTPCREYDYWVNKACEHRVAVCVKKDVEIFRTPKRITLNFSRLKTKWSGSAGQEERYEIKLAQIKFGVHSASRETPALRTAVRVTPISTIRKRTYGSWASYDDANGDAWVEFGRNKILGLF